MRNITDISVLLDRSGSMDMVREPAIAGVNAFLRGQRKEGPDNLYTLVQFDSPDFPHWYQIVHNGVPMKEVPDLTLETYVPRGNTALLDAIGMTIDAIGDRLERMNPEDRPERVMLAIYTDGQENWSRKFSNQRIREMIQHQSDVYSWQIIFLAANQDAIATGHAIGVKGHYCVNTVQDSAGMKAQGAVLHNMAMAYQQAGAHGLQAMSMQGSYDEIRSSIAAEEEEEQKAKEKPKVSVSPFTHWGSKK